MSKPFDPAALAQAIRQNRGPAPVHLWNPPFCGEIDMRIGSDGTWYYQDSPIQRPAMVKLFSSVLRLDEDQHYYLVTPAEKVRIRVDDFPLAAQLLEAEGRAEQQKLTFITNTDERIVADKEHPIIVDEDGDGNPHPHLLCRTNLHALIARNVFYQLAELAEPGPWEGQEVMGVWSGGIFFRLGTQI
mgnify:CR=1 FL=1